MTDHLLDDEPATPAEMASVLQEASELLDSVMSSIEDARHSTENLAYLDTLDDVFSRVRRAWATVTVSRTSLANLGMRTTLHRVTGLTE